MGRKALLHGAECGSPLALGAEKKISLVFKGEPNALKRVRAGDRHLEIALQGDNLISNWPKFLLYHLFRQGGSIQPNLRLDRQQSGLRLCGASSSGDGARDGVARQPLRGAPRLMDGSGAAAGLVPYLAGAGGNAEGWAPRP